MEIQFTNQAALITGATSGIGEATAKRLAASGAKIFITGRKEDVLKEISTKIEKDGVPCRFFAGNLANDQFRTDLIDRAVAEYGRLDILVNAAGIIGSGTIENTTLKDYDEMLDINLRTMFHLIQLALPHLKKVEGNIVNVGSVTGLRAFPGVFAYCISKAGVDQLTRVAALELAESGVRVNAVNPGVVETNLHRRAGMDETSYRNFLDHSKTTHPLGRVGQPQEIADLITFLSSRHAGWITGETISIDGGRHQTCAR